MERVHSPPLHHRSHQYDTCVDRFQQKGSISYRRHQERGTHLMDPGLITANAVRITTPWNAGTRSEAKSEFRGYRLRY